MNTNENKIVVLACSGASNTGDYSDKVARNLIRNSSAKMLCLARFSVDKKFADKTSVELNSMEEKAGLFIIDGCPVNCAELTAKQNGIEKYTHLNITDFDIVKGKTPVIEEKVNEIAEHISSAHGIL